MARGKGGKQYDEDDYDDGYDDYEDYDEEYHEEYHAQGATSEVPGAAPTPAPVQIPGGVDAAAVWRCPACTFDNLPQHLACDVCGTARPPPTPRSSMAQVPLPSVEKAAQGASVSPLGQALSQPAPKPAQKRTAAGRDASQGFPLPASSTTGEGIEPFAFDTPSPDDAVLVARMKGTGSAAAAQRQAKVLADAASGQERARRKSVSAVQGAAGGGPSEATLEEAVAGMRRMSLPEAAAPKGGDTAGGSRSRSRSPLPWGARTPGSSAPSPSSRRSLPLASYVADAGELKELEGRLGGEGRGKKDLLHLIVVGHVDAGKSTLMGRLLHALGHVSQKDMHKNEKESREKGKASFAYAWVLDEGMEERTRGVTMTVAMAHFETPSKQVVLLDAPGHRDFVPNMISGASQADAAVLVVDATPGGYEAGMEGEGGVGGQTKEHAQLARSLGVEQLVVAVNKMDVVGYGRARFDAIRQQLAPFLKHCGFQDAAVQWLPVSGTEAQNLTTPADDPRLTAWWEPASMPSLLAAVDALKAPVRQVAKPLRLILAETGIKSRALGQAAASGKLEGGFLKPGSKVVVMPGGESAVVKAVERNGEALAGARAGDSVDIGLTGLDPALLLPGGVVCHPDYPVAVVTRLEARILTLGILMPILRGTPLVLHAHHAREPARVTEIVALLDSKTGTVSKQKPRHITKNQSAIVELVPERGMCLECYADYRALGRIALRDTGKTLAVGIVTKILEWT